MKNKKLTICFLGSASSIHTLRWIHFFAEEGHHVHLFSFDPLLSHYDLGNIIFHELKKIQLVDSWIVNLVLASPLKRHLKKILIEIKPDIVHAHYVTDYGSLGVLSDFHPFILTAWGSDILIVPKKFFLTEFSVRYYLQKADLITCDAEHLKKEMEVFGAKASKIKIINFGIDTEKFKPGLIDQELKKRLGITNQKVVISLRSLYPVYDLKSFIKAAAIVIKEYPNVKFIIIGDGPQEKELKNLVENLGISDAVIFTGFINRKDIPFFLGMSDIYASISLSDAGIASSTAEAMACELPVVVTDVADNKEWIKDGENGFVIRPENPKELASKVIYLLRNKQVRKEFGSRSRKIIEDKNSYHNEMAKMEKFYYKFVDK